MPDLTPLTDWYGPQPECDAHTRCTLAHEWDGPAHRMRIWSIGVGAPEWVSWLVYQALPLSTEPRVRVLSPDGCWPHVINEVAVNSVIAAGQSLLWFDRLSLAWDGPQAERGGPLHRRWPGSNWSAIAVWAWGIRQSILALSDPRAEAVWGVLGHSRGGKAALVAAALDDRIHAVISHNSGTGGAASLLHTGQGAEPLSALASTYPHWLATSAQDPEVQERLIRTNAPAQWLASIAPRGLCVLQAEDDLWANPLGTRKMVEALTPQWLAAPEALQHHTRLGGHRITEADWQRATAFMAQVSARHAGHGAPPFNA